MAHVYVDAINSFWETTPEENEIIHKATSCFKEGYQFSPKFQNRQWDGMVRMYNPTNRSLPSGLVRDAIDALAHAGKTVTSSFRTHKILQNTVPRPGEEGWMNFDLGGTHQFDAFSRLCEEPRGILHAATNAGKTKIAEAWCVLHNVKVLYLVPSKELLRQTVKSFAQDTGLDVGQICAGEPWTIGKHVTVCLMTSVAPRVSKAKGRKLINAQAVEDFKKVAHEFDAVFVDECHHLAAETWRNVMRSLKNAHFRYGLSGTPWSTREEELKVKCHLGPVLATITNEDLISQGWSAKPTIHMVTNTTEVSVGKYDFQESDEQAALEYYAAAYQEGIVENHSRNSDIIRLCKKLIDQKKTCLVIADRVEHCYDLEAMLLAAGVGCNTITGQKTPAKMRESFLRNFIAGEFPVLVSNVVNEGIDIPNLNALVFAAGGKAPKKLLQRVGRGIRKKLVGDNVVEIYDFIDLGCDTLLKHAEQRMAIYRHEGFEIKRVLA